MAESNLPIATLLRRRVFKLEVPVRFDEKQAAESLAKKRGVPVAELMRSLLLAEVEKEGEE